MANWPLKDVAEHYRRMGSTCPVHDACGSGRQAPKQSHTRGVMNKTEGAYADSLSLHVTIGDISEYWFERFTFRLADKLSFTPDFLTIRTAVVSNAVSACNESAHIWLPIGSEYARMLADGKEFTCEGVCCDEVKACTSDGRVLIKDDSMVKLKMAAELYPWITWRLCARLRDGSWKIKEIGK